MRVKTMLAVMVVLTALVPIGGCSGTVTPEFMGNDGMLKAGVGFGDPNAGTIGFRAGWNERQPQDLWSVSAVGKYDIGGPVTGVLDKALGTPNEWWQLLDSLGGRLYLLVEVGPVDLAGAPQAMSAPGVGVALGPFTFEYTYEIFENGKMLDGTGVLARSGTQAWFGVQRAFWF